MVEAVGGNDRDRSVCRPACTPITPAAPPVCPTFPLIDVAATKPFREDLVDRDDLGGIADRCASSMGNDRADLTGRHANVFHRRFRACHLSYR